MITPRVARAFLLASIGIVAFGLILHAAIPSRFDSDATVMAQGQPYVAPLDRGSAAPVPQALEITVSFPNEPWIWLYRTETHYAIVNHTELDRFMAGTNFTDLVPFKAEDEFSVRTDSSGLFVTISISFPARHGASLALLVVTNSTYSISISSYFSTIPITYRPGMAMMAGGFLAMFAVLTWTLRGWKRLLAIGAGINTALFWLRASSLATPLSVDPILANVFTVEAYADFQFQTLIWTKALASGVDLYSPAVAIAYPYPPLYAEMCGLFDLLPLPAWKLALPILAFTILTALLVRKITLDLVHDEKRAGIAMLLYLVNPFVLFYGSYAWLSPPMFVFFVVLAFYLAIKRKGAWPTVALGIAIATKQYALVFFPLLLVAMIRSSGARTPRAVAWKVFIATAACGGTIALASMPYIAIDPFGYLERVYLSGAGGPGAVAYLSLFYKFNSYPVTFNSFFFFIGAPVPFTDAIAWALAYNIPLLACGAGVYVAFFIVSRKVKIGDDQAATSVYFARLLFFSLLLVLFLHVFYSHTYKYYFILLAPFVSILHDPSDLDLRKAVSKPAMRIDRRWLLPTLYSLFLVLCYRYVYLMFVLAWAIYLILKERGSIDRLTARLWKGKTPPAVVS
ncbi:MAG: hypothetical protein Q6373_010370 [Candidatus Sigynarchaeota archaeon]